MKKIISVLLSIVILFSVGAIGTSAAAANAEEENLCEEFEKLVSFCDAYNPVSPFNLYTIVGWTSEYVPDFYEKYYNPNTTVYQVPRNELDMYVNNCFALENGYFQNLVEQDKAEEYPLLTYDESNGTYSFSIGGWGGPTYSYRKLMGYTKGTDTYTVYISKLPKLFDTLQDLLDYEGTTVEDWGDRLKSTEDGKYYIELPIERQENIKLTVAYDGENIKLIEGVKVDTIPDSSDMITPIEKPTETPKVNYDVPEGVKVEGDTAFPENTLVKVENITSGEIYNRVEKAVGEIVFKGKIAVFEFTATANHTAVQPNGKVKVSFNLPDNLSTKDLKMYYVAEDGKTEEIKITIDEDSKTVVAELEHFSTYVLCNVKIVHAIDDDNSSEGSTPTSPQTGDTSNFVLFAILLFASATVLTVLIISKKGAYSKH